MTAPGVNALAAPATMRAALLRSRAGAEAIAIERINVPHLSEDDALVAVTAAAITPSELGWQPTWTHPDGTDRSPVVPAHEMAGVVVAIGSAVTDLNVGAQVFGVTDFYRDGAAAEYVAVRALDLAEWPTSLLSVEAAAVPLSGLTAWQALFDVGHLIAGQRVLVHGAAGGVGTFAVQLARVAGAHVVAVAARDDAKLVRDLGADEVIDRRSTDFAEVGPPVDLIIDTVGGDVLERSWSHLTGNGRLVSIAPTSRAVGERDSRGFFFIVAPDRGVLTELARLVEAGELRVVVERVFPLDEAREAYEFGQRKHPRGKVVLRVRD